MFQNFLKIAFRNLLKNKIYSFINITGLAVGLASFMVISEFVRSEISFDDFHENADRIYRSVGIFNRPGIGRVHNGVTPGPLGPALVEDFPQIVSATRVRPMFTTFCQAGEKGFYESDIAMVDPDIFDIFTIPLKNGDPETALSNPNSMVIDVEFAEKYFGNEQAIGKTLTIHTGNEIRDYTVTGVIEKYPENSHLSFNALGSFSSIENDRGFYKSFKSNSLATYVLLADGATPAEIEQQIPNFINKHVPDHNTLETWYLQSLKDIHLHSNHLLYQTYNRHQGNINTVYMFSIIAILVLLIACVNFMNLATARSAQRAKEVGLRKVVGSERRQLIHQFIGESILVTGISLLISLVLVQVASPFLQQLTDNRISVPLTNNWQYLLEIISITLMVGVVAGSYPAFFLSAFKPVDTLKGSFSAGNRGARLRKGLVLAQFAIAITLIICTGIVKDQMDYIRKKDLGINPEQVMYVPMRDQETRQKYAVLKNEFNRHPDILNVAVSAGTRGAGGSNGIVTVAETGGESQIMMRFSSVDHDFLETVGAEIIQGRNFIKGSSVDSSTSVLINETAAKELGWIDAVGKKFEGGDNNPDLTVIGVIKDYHFHSLRNKIEPQMLYINPNQYYYLLLKVKTENVASAIAFVEQTWKRIVPGRPFEHGFLNESFARMYRAEENAASLFSTFAGLAIFIACLGLFGLASFTAEQKTKEIGIRKVLGASVASVVILLSKQFVKWVAVASLIAFPVAYIVIQGWLNNFVYRTTIQLSTFIFAAFLAVVIALLTVSFQAVRTAFTNPADALRYE